MKLILSISILIFSFTHALCQSKEISFGVGPTVSLFYLNGGPMKNWGTANLNNETPKRKNIGTSFSLQYNKFNKKDIGYFIALSYDIYGIPFTNTYRYKDFLVNVDTREKYKTIFLNTGFEKRVKFNAWNVNFGVGLHTFFYFDQQIDIENVIGDNGLPVTKLFVRDRWGNEAGASLGIKLAREINSKFKVGINPTYFYSLSTWESEKFSSNLFFTVTL